MKREIAKSLHDALSACDEIETFVGSASRDSFRQDRALQLIVERLHLIVGEAISRATKANESLFRALPDAHDIIGTRNRIVHGYDEINIDLVWDIADSEIPSLRATLRGLLDS